MMVKAYDLKSAQELVRDAIERSKRRHENWRIYETLYRTGSVETAKAVAKDAGQLDKLIADVGLETINMVLPHANVIISSVIAHSPRHICTPYGGGEEAEAGAKVAEAVLRYFWMRAHATPDLKDATWDMVVCGNGFLKVGWTHQESDRDLDNLELEEQLTDLLEADRATAELEGDDPSDPGDLVDLLEPTQVLIELDEPYVEYVSPFDIFVPPNARRMHETRWVAQRLTLPLDELKSNDMFRAEARERLTADAGSNENAAAWKQQTEDEKGYRGNSEAFKTATIFEFYDMRSRTLLVFQLDAKDPLYEGELPYAHRYPPFVHLRNYSMNGNEFWAFGDLENVASVQHQLNEFFTAQIDSARRAGNKYVVVEGAWTEDLVNLIEDDTADGVAKIKNPDGLNINELVQAIERKPLPAEVFQAKAELEEYLRKVLGINDFQAGGVGADRMSATAAAVVDGVASLRAQEKVAQVEDGAAQVGNLMLLLCQEFLDTPTVIRVAGPNGGALWPEVDSEMIRGEFLVAVEGGSTKAINPATREQKGMRTLSEVLPLLQQLGYDPTPALRSGLRDLGYDPDVMLVQLPAPPAPPEGAPGAPAPEGGELPADVTQYGGPPTSADAQAAGDLAL